MAGFDLAFAALLLAALLLVALVLTALVLVALFFSAGLPAFLRTGSDSSTASSTRLMSSVTASIDCMPSTVASLRFSE